MCIVAAFDQGYTGQMLDTAARSCHSYEITSYWMFKGNLENKEPAQQVCEGPALPPFANDFPIRKALGQDREPGLERSTLCNV